MDDSYISRGIALSILTILAIVFGSIYMFGGKQRFSGWIGLAYLSGSISFLLDVTHFLINPVISDIFAKITMWGFSIFVVCAVFHRHERRLPLRSLAALFTAGLSSLMWFSFVDPNIIMRSVCSATIAGVILLIAAPTLWYHRRGKLGTLMLAIIMSISLMYFARLVVVYGILGMTHSAETYQQSLYATILHASSAISALACGVTMLIVAGYDVIRKQQIEMTIDPLTGLNNRRGLDHILDQNDAPPFINGENRAVIIFDLDHFKLINDRFGHETGDRVLKRIGSKVRKMIGTHGDAARIGGEEFVLIINAISAPISIVLADQIRVALSLLIHPELDEGQCVTSSFGVAHMEKGESFNMTLRRADMALYRAKSEGRNRIVEASPSEAIHSKRIPALKVAPDSAN